jgi:hypothetical protein
MFIDKVYVAVRDVYHDRKDFIRGKRRREDGTKVISTSKKKSK